MPNYIFTQDLGRLKLNELLYFKKRWEVPARSIIYRAKELGILSEKQATYFYIETSRLGWARQEPDSLPRVKPKLFEDLLKLLSEDFEDELAFSNYLGIPYKWVNSWLDKGKVAYLKLVV
jgi:Zn-dependent peptidase ImmA (M78 family)